METEAKIDSAKRTWKPSKGNLILLCVGSVFLITLCGPIGMNLVTVLLISSLPESYSGFVSFLSFVYSLFIPMVWFITALGAPLYALIMIFGRKQKKFLPFAVFIWFVVWGSLPLSWSMNSWRNPGLERITVRAQPLIEAIEAYQDETDKYPPDLEALVPEYMDEIPYTGAVGYPDFRYNRAKADSLFETYEVLVNTPPSMMGFDVFVYWPEKNYPESMYGGWVEPMKDWAYVHE